MNTRRWLALMIFVVLVVAGTCIQLTRPYGISGAHPLGTRAHPAAAQVNDSGTSTATIRRSSLSQTTSVTGTLGYAGGDSVLGRIAGTITWLPSLGQVIRQGQVLYRVDGRPVVLLYGSVPAYRDLVADVAATDLKGQDVAELNHDLVALGYLHRTEVDSAWNEFTWATVGGVQLLQHHLHTRRTGGLALGEAVFLPGAVRVTAVEGTRGGSAQGAILHTSSTRRMVTVALSADLQSEVAIGDRVMITLPDTSTTAGLVSSVGTVATIPSPTTGDQGPEDNAATIAVTIALTSPRSIGHLDQAPVVVGIIGRTVHDVLAVPVSALLTRSDGRYAVEVVGADGTHRLVPVTTGLYDDSRLLVQISGAGLSAGQRVVVAGQ